MAYIQLQKDSMKSGSARVSVHLATNQWNKEKKQSKQKRTYLGSLLPDDMVALTKKIAGSHDIKVPLEELRRQAADGTDLLSWLNSMIPNHVVTKSESIELTPKAILRVGEVHLLGVIAEEIGLQRSLCNAFGQEDGLALLALAEYQVAEARPLYLAKAWLEEAAIAPELAKRDFSSRELSQFMAQLGEELPKRNAFTKAWISACGSPKAIIYDTTSISTHSANLEGAEFGYNRDGDRLPQINLALVSGKDGGMPLMHRIVSGSIPDVSTLQKTGEFMREYGLDEFSYSLDRGFYSQANVRDLLKNGIGFTLGVPFTNKQSSGLVKKHRSALASPKRSFSFNDQLLRHVQDSWMVEVDGEKRKIAAHLYFDAARWVSQSDSLEKKVLAIEARASKEKFQQRKDAIFWLKDNALSFYTCFTIKTSGEAIKVVRRPHRVARMTTFMGYTLVITTDMQADREAVLSSYRCRDSIEKLFDIFKNENDQHRMRSGDATIVEGRMFLAFIALALHAALERRMVTSQLIKKYSVAELLAEVRKIKTVCMPSGKRLLLEITKRQREALLALGVPPPNMATIS